MISFLKKVDENGEEKSSKFMGKGDIIFLLCVGSLVGGFWYFSKSAKEDTFTHFTRCDSLYKADSMVAAKSCYEASLELGYRTDSLDSVAYLRTEQLENLRENETAQARAVDSLTRLGDSLSAWKIKEPVTKTYFLEGEALKRWESVHPPIVQREETAPAEP